MIPSPSICEVNRPLWWNGFLMDCEFPGKPAREKYSIIKILFHYYGFSTKDKKGITIKRQPFSMSRICDKKRSSVLFGVPLKVALF